MFFSEPKCQINNSFSLQGTASPVSDVAHGPPDYVVTTQSW